MTKRFVAAGLWFYAAWYCGNILAAFAPVSPLIGPAFGAVFGALILAKPARELWASRSAAHAAALKSVASNAAVEDDTVITST